MLQFLFLLPSRLPAFLCLFILSFSLHAIDARLSLSVGEADQDLKQVENLLTLIERLDVDQLELNIKRVVESQNIAQSCVNTNESRIQGLADDLELLGEPAAGDPGELIKKREGIQREMLSNAQQLASCRLMLLRSDESLRQLTERQNLLLRQELMHQIAPLQTLLLQALSHPASLIPDFSLPRIPFAHIEKQLGWIGLFNVTWLLLMLALRQLVLRLLQRARELAEVSFWQRITVSLLSCLRRYITALMILVGLLLQVLWLLPNNELRSLVGHLLVLAILLNLSALVVRILLRPCASEATALDLEAGLRNRLAAQFNWLNTTLIGGLALFQSLHIVNFSEPVEQLLTNIYLPLLALPLSALFWQIAALPWGTKLRRFRFLSILMLWLIVLGSWFGYQNFAIYLLKGLTGSLVLLLVLIGISSLTKQLFDSLDEGQGQWQNRLRHKLNLKSQDLLPGSIWLRLTIGIGLWIGFAVISLQLWGVPENRQQQLTSALTEGFKLGDINVVPSRVLTAVVIFALMLSFISWAKQSLQQNWLQRLQMERGSKEAVVSLTGYFGLIMAVLFALSIAGFQLSNLALIAGALSVGIGFGLQNIFNNFVSGLILLFERPIKTGDWVVVGSTQGLVRKISIRSTIIQTWDRADVIVPNSELISSQVINWMYKDSVGRVIIPVGVSYDSDPEQVKEILQKIGFELPMVITNSPILPNPWVLFRGLGDSSMNFELRAFISVITEKPKVESEAYFAIVREFRKAGIEIPFPQRDLHIRSKVTSELDVLTPESISETDKQPLT